MKHLDEVAEFKIKVKTFYDMIIAPAGFWPRGLPKPEEASL